MDINASTFTGNATKDVQVKKSRKGNVYARFWIGCDYSVKSDQQTVFIPCLVFGKAAQYAAKYIHKGTNIAISGYTRQSPITTAHGDKVNSTILVLTNFQWFSKSSFNKSTKANTINIDPKDIPFLNK